MFWFILGSIESGNIHFLLSFYLDEIRFVV